MTYEPKAQRLVYGQTLKELGAEYEKLVVLDADVSASTQSQIFAKAYPERFFNCGIAEANMVGIAAGFAAAGLVPFASSFGFLIALRAGDDIRSFAAYNDLNVKLCGAYAGLSDFADGASHQTIEDIGVLRALPNMKIFTPTDLSTTRGAIRAMIETPGPCYIRISREAVPELHDAYETPVVPGKASVIREGKDLTLAVCGSLLSNALEASKMLEKDGIEAEIIEYTSVKPFDAETLVKSVQKTSRCFSVEEHNVLGGFGAACAEVLSEQCPVRLTRIGIQDRFGESGKYAELLHANGLDTEGIYRTILSKR
ncbi:MAG: hypothetical protein IKI54_02670 [Lachnospiraceae bacterium]|nr:hypothetical protein [Lachnospiraceae bacterium]